MSEERSKRSRFVVVTGASSGIGEACALLLDMMGFGVFATVRKPEDAEALKQKASPRLLPLILDVTDRESVAKASETIHRRLRGRGLGGLVNNAGIAVAGPLEFLPLEELEKVFRVNTVGQIAVTQSLLPLLRKGRGRVVNIGSVSGRVTLPLLGPYSASKFALEALTDALRMELKPWEMHVAIIEPGGIATPIWRKALAGEESLAEKMPAQTLDFYGELIAAQRTRAQATDANGVPPESVARAVVHALTSARPKTRYPVGGRAALGEVLRLLPASIRESLILRQLG